MLRKTIATAAIVGSALGGLGLAGGDAHADLSSKTLVDSGPTYCLEIWTWNFSEQMFVYQMSCGDGTTLTKAIPMGG